MAELERLWPPEFVTPAGAARADREVVADQLAATVCEDRWTARPTCALLLVATGRRASDAGVVAGMLRKIAALPASAG